MYILGYSGLHGIIDFKKKLLNSTDVVDNRIVQGMDASACLLKDGKIIAAAEEERFINEKHTCNFPYNAINACLKQANISIQDVNMICHGFDFDKYQYFYQGDDFNRTLYKEILSSDAQCGFIKNFYPEVNSQNIFKPTQHHLAHAASAFYPSCFPEALIIVADAMGETHSISVFHGKNAHIQPLAQYDLFSSIGMLYSLMTAHLGFLPNEDEYKIMGLAPYGDPKKYQEFFTELILLEDEGEIIIPNLISSHKVSDKYNYGSFRDYLNKNLGFARKPDELITQYHKDIAAALQQRTNEAMLHLCSYWQRQTNLDYCCMAGGVALNCVTNTYLSKAKLFKKMYVQPAASDAGTSLGAALYHHYQCYPKTELADHGIKSLPYYGPHSNGSEVIDIAKNYAEFLHFDELDYDVICSKAAKLISRNQVIAWVQGRMEFGPRALGHRSILANPCHKDMQNIVNLMVKKRESFRPFAPAVKAEQAGTYFELNDCADYDHMLFVCDVKPEYQGTFPAITHVDNTARVQIVHQSMQPLFWQLLDNVEQETGYGIVLNTSFNVKGQAMICYPQQAIETFLNTSLDALVIHNILFTKKKGNNKC